MPAYYVLAPAEASTNLSRYDGVRFGHRCENPVDLDDLYRRSRGEGFGPEVKRRILTGTYALSVGYYDAYYRQAQRVRRRILESFTEAFQSVDALFLPTTPTTAFKLGEKRNDPIALYEEDRFTIPANLAGLPALSLPVGLSDGLPVGGQLLAPHFEEGRILRPGPRLSAGHGSPPEAADGGRGRLMNWDVVIGLEVHAQLQTASKLFSSAPNAAGATPNETASAVELGLPGTLPVPNAEAIRLALRFGAAIDAELATETIFARKNYFYLTSPRAIRSANWTPPSSAGAR